MTNQDTPAVRIEHVADRAEAILKDMRIVEERGMLTEASRASMNAIANVSDAADALLVLASDRPAWVRQTDGLVKQAATTLGRILDDFERLSR